MKTIIVVAGAALALASCSDPAPQSGPVEKVQIAEPTPPAAPVAPAAPVSEWSYQKDADAMRGTTDEFASLSSKDVVRTAWPYDPSPMRLTVRRRSTDGVNVMLQITGQFVCNSYNGTKVTVKFDDGPLETFRCNEADSGPNDVVFIEPTQKFITRMKASKTMMVEAPVYEVGNAQVTFNVAGLVWE